MGDYAELGAFILAVFVAVAAAAKFSGRQEQQVDNGAKRIDDLQTALDAVNGAVGRLRESGNCHDSDIKLIKQAVDNLSGQISTLFKLQEKQGDKLEKYFDRLHDQRKK